MGYSQTPKQYRGNQLRFDKSKPSHRPIVCEDRQSKVKATLATLKKTLICPK